MAQIKRHGNPDDSGRPVAGQQDDLGFVGQKVDPTPSENYTVEGVTKGAPTPETDAQAAAEAEAALREGTVTAGDASQPGPQE